MKINSFSYLDLKYYLLMRSPFKLTAYMYVIFAISFMGTCPGPPPSYAPDEEKKILPSLVYVLNKT